MGCLKATDILLPAKGICQEKWAVVACDQYTSQPQYWEAVAREVKDSASTLHLIYPEVYLESEDQQESTARIERIRAYMDQYLKEGILTEQVRGGFSLSVRSLEGGLRIGLMAALDLEAYDYTPGTGLPVRATEGTVASRIPPRVRVREGAVLESPHVIVLLDDPREQVIESLYARRQELPILYDTELMAEGGHLTGYKVGGSLAREVQEKLEKLEAESGGFFLAVGDGNHSLATAKTCWEKKKRELTEKEREHHPARYALVEVVNLRELSMTFEPIHRVVFEENMNQLVKQFQEFLKNLGIPWTETDDTQTADLRFVQKEMELGMKLGLDGGRLALDYLQRFLDGYITPESGKRLDYVHGQEAVEALASESRVCGILLGSMDKAQLFPAIQAGGVLPRKTFSIGEANEKRYYMECRRL